MIEALIAGERDPAVLADLAQARMRSKIPELTYAHSMIIAIWWMLTNDCD